MGEGLLRTVAENRKLFCAAHTAGQVGGDVAACVLIMIMQSWSVVVGVWARGCCVPLLITGRGSSCSMQHARQARWMVVLKWQLVCGCGWVHGRGGAA
jgi:hypothetical protein